jgi:hypothetical protein
MGQFLLMLKLLQPWAQGTFFFKFVSETIGHDLKNV